jgi:hypothetical protein
MSDLKLDDLTGDLVIENADLVLTTGSDAVRQHLLQRLRTFMGEWFLNLDAGLPYFQNILIKDPNLNAIDGVIKNVIIDTPGVLELLSFDMNYDSSTQALELTFSVQVSDGVLDFTETFGEAA